jgi:putative cell wall-binding protein
MSASGVPSGNVVMSGSYVTTSGSTTFTVPTLATINNVTVTPAPPLSVIAAGTGDASISNLSITLPSTTTVQPSTYTYSPTGSLYFALCVTLTTSGVTFENVSGAPSVSQTNGASNATLASTSAVQVAGTGTASATEAIELGAVSTTNAPTYTLSDLHVDVPATGVANGPVTVTVSYNSGSTETAATNACAPGSSNLVTLVTGQTAFLVGSAPSGPISGTTAAGTTAAEFDAAFVSTSNSTATCSNNGNAVLATSAKPYDALSAAYLEGLLHTGVLITPPTTPIDPNTLAALQYAGVQRVYVVGGTLAVSQAVITALQALPAYNCGGLTKTGSNIVVYSGISGQTADDTAVAIDNYVSASLSGNLPSITGAYSTESTFNQTSGNETTAAPTNGTQTTALVVSDTDYKDAATAAGLAWRYHLPVILTTPTALSATASAELTKLGITQVIALGGQLALTPAVVTSIQALTVNGAPISVFRIAGQDATQTAADVALFEGTELSWPASTVLVAQGQGWSDALGAAALSGMNEEPLLLTEGPVAGVGQYTLAALKTAGTVPNGLGGGVTAGIQVLGGSLAVPQSQITQMQQALSAG